LFSTSSAQEIWHQVFTIFEEKITGIDYPVKIVVVVEHINATVITCYPLKKRRNA
jgi:hypothetical protein